MTAMDIRSAIATVRSNPTAVEELDKAEAAAAKAAEKEAKRVRELNAKVAELTDERAAALVADYYQVQSEAVLDAAHELAIMQLRQEVGLVSPQHIARTGPVAQRLGPGRVERVLKGLMSASAIPWDRAGRSADERRTAMTAEAAKAAPPILPDPGWTPEELARRAGDKDGARDAAREARRQREIAARKAQGRADGVLR